MTDKGKEICKYVNEDKELYIFFKKLTDYYKTVLAAAIEDVDYIENLNEPNLQTISNAIEKIEQSGIVIDDKEIWLNEELYTNQSIVYGTIFHSVMFSGHKINGRDIDVFENQIGYIEAGTSTHCLTDIEVKYMEWHRYNDYDSIKKEYEKENKKYTKKTEKGKKTFEKSEKLKSLEDKLRHVDYLKKETEFFENLTEEQIRNIIDAYKQIKTTKANYDNYLLNKKRQDTYVNENKDDLYKTAFIKMLEQTLVEVDINNIIKKLFVIFVVVEMNPIEGDLSEQEFDFDIDAVNWFVEFKFKAIEELYEKVFNVKNFSIAVATVCDKVLKK